MTFAPSFLGSSLGLTGHGGPGTCPYTGVAAVVPEAADGGSTMVPQARGPAEGEESWGLWQEVGGSHPVTHSCSRQGLFSGLFVP